MDEREREQFEAWLASIGASHWDFTTKEVARAGWRARAALAPAQPIYQERNANGSWTDISKQFFDAHAECCALKDRVRVVYAAPSPTKDQT